MTIQGRCWAETDLADVAIEASYALMMLKKEGPKKKYLQKIKEGIELLDALETGMKVIDSGKVETPYEFDCWLAVKKYVG